MSNRRGPHVIARPRKRAELTTTEIDSNKLAELIAKVPQPEPVSPGRAATRSVSNEALAELVAQPTRVAPPPPAPPRLAHTKRRAEATRAATDGMSFEDPTTVHTRTTGSIPVERETARGSVVELPTADDVSAAVSMMASPARLATGSDPVIAAVPDDEAHDRPTRRSAVAEGSGGMTPVGNDDVVQQDVVPIPAPMRARAIALSGVLAAAAVAIAWWLVH